MTAFHFNLRLGTYGTMDTGAAVELAVPALLMTLGLVGIWVLPAVDRA